MKAILRVARARNQYETRWKLPNDPVNGRRLTIHQAHDLDAALVQWHFSFHHETTAR